MASVPTFWCRKPSQGNVGDRLAPWLVRRITGAPARWVPPGSPGRTYFLSGSIAALAGRGAVIWGSGIMTADERLHLGVEVAAVRGPLTRERARLTVDCPAVYGDPALLLPRFLPRRPDRRGPPGLVPHFADKARASSAFPHGWSMVDVQQPVEGFVDAVVGCRFVASSSLHGIIISHAYGVPAVWVSLSDLQDGDGTKFHDYFLSVGLPVPAPLHVDLVTGAVNQARLEGAATLPAALPDLDLLFERCPLR